jgi:hypothetical protein
MNQVTRRTLCLTMLLLAIGATAASATAKDGFYKGSSGLYPLSFHVTGAGTKITSFKLAYEITTCGPPGDADKAPSYTFPTMHLAHGSFSGSTDTKNKTELFTFKVSGKISAGEMSGTGAATDKIKSFHTCTEHFKITAKLQ